MPDTPERSDDRGGAVADALQHVLGNTCRLAVTTLSFHWNVTGPRFGALHDLFEAQYCELWAALDPIGERIRALGHPALADHADEVVVPFLDGRGALPMADRMRHVLADGHANIEIALQAALDVAQGAGDEGTAAILGERLVAHGKHRWMLRAFD